MTASYKERNISYMVDARKANDHRKMNTMNNYAIIFNGPKRSGKDQSVEYLQEVAEGALVVPMMFKEPLYAISAAIYGIDLSDFIELASDRATKETPLVRLHGKSPRDVLIEVSEKVIKPFYGKSFFGDFAVTEMKRINHEVRIRDESNFPIVFAFSDGGFPEETQPVLDFVGKNNLRIVRVYRYGCDFAGDSRGYLSMVDFPDVKFSRLQNDGSLDDLRTNVEKIFNQALNPQ